MTFTEAFDRICPMYLMYGMSYREFWNEDPYMVRIYQEAYLLKRRAENEKMWMLGAYIQNAVGSAVGTIFGKKRVKYLEKPLEIFAKTAYEKEAERMEKIQRLKDDLKAWKDSWRPSGKK